MKAALLVLLLSASFAGVVTGQTWRLLNPVLSHTVVLNPKNPDVLYVGNWANQMYRSNDAGRSWDLLAIGSSAATNFVTSIATSSLDTGVIIATGFGFDGISRSSNGGQTWTRVLNDTSNFRMWYISEAIIEDEGRPGAFFGARGTPNNGIWRSTDDGMTWDSISVVPRNITSRLCTIAQRRDSTNIFFLGCKGGVIMRSDDACLTWKRVPVLRGALMIKPDAEIPKINFSPRDPRVGYAVVAITDPTTIKDNGGVLKTTDGGATWDRIAFADTSFWAVDVRDAGNGNDEVFIGGFRTTILPTVIKGDSLVYRSSDGGSTWTQFLNIPWGGNELGDSDKIVWSIRWDPAGKKMYMAAATGIFVLDEPMSATDNAIVDAHTTLVIGVTTSEIIVRDNSMNDDHTSWALYTMDATRVLWGLVDNPNNQMIPTVALPSGRYLLTWGSERRFRTALVTLIR